MYRSAMLFVILMLPGLPLTAQHVLATSPTRAALRVERSAPEWSEAGAAPLIPVDPVPRGAYSFPPLLAASEWAQATCPGRAPRIVAGVALGLLLGGAIGYVHGSAGHPGLPHIGLDVPSELEYTPLFAIAGGIAGGIIGARTARCT